MSTPIERSSLPELIALHEAVSDDMHQRDVAPFIRRAQEMERERSLGRKQDPRRELALRNLLRALLPSPGDGPRTVASDAPAGEPQRSDPDQEVAR